MADSSHTFLLDEPQQTPNRRRLRGGTGLAILGAIALVAGLIAADVALIGSVQRPAPRPIMMRQVVRVSGSPRVASTVYLSVSAGIKPGPDGKLHDAFSVTGFTVHAGQPVRLVIDNTDNTVHSITSPAAGVNIVAKPGSHSYTLLVAKSGVFEWYCNYPCDPYSMTHDGYMRGTITSI